MFRLTLPLALVAAFVLAACGVKGPLEPPPGAPTAPHAAVVAPPPTVGNIGFQAATSASDMANATTPHAEWGKQRSLSSGGAPTQAQEIGRPQRPFILDGLL